MTSIGIFTAEPENFVPVELHKAALAAGFECQIVDITKVMLHEGEVSKVTLGEVELNFDIIIPRLNEHNIETKLGVLRRLQANGAYLLNTPEALEACNDKLLTQFLLNNAKFKTPFSVSVTSSDELPKALELFKFPVIIKTLRGTHGIGVMKVDSMASGVSVAQAMLQREQVMLQEFIEHEASYRIIMIGAELLAANERSQPGKDEFRTNSHLGSKTKFYEPSTDELELAVKVAAALKCNFCAIDYIKLSDGSLVVLEVNGSPGLEAIQQNYLGTNLAANVIAWLGKIVKFGRRFHKTHVKPEDLQTVEQPRYDYKTLLRKPQDQPEIVALRPAKEPETVQKQSNIGEIVNVKLIRLMDEPVEARVDTGAHYSSLHATNIEVKDDDSVTFERTGVKYKVFNSRSVKIKNADNLVRRPIIMLDIEVDGVRYNQVEFTINDREHMKYEVLLGRNALGLMNIPIELSVIVRDETLEPSEVIVQGEEE